MSGAFCCWWIPERMCWRTETKFSRKRLPPHILSGTKWCRQPAMNLHDDYRVNSFKLGMKIYNLSAYNPENCWPDLDKISTDGFWWCISWRPNLGAWISILLCLGIHWLALCPASAESFTVNCFCPLTDHSSPLKSAQLSTLQESSVQNNSSGNTRWTEHLLTEGWRCRGRLWKSFLPLFIQKYLAKQKTRGLCPIFHHSVWTILQNISMFRKKPLGPFFVAKACMNSKQDEKLLSSAGTFAGSCLRARDFCVVAVLPSGFL